MTPNPRPPAGSNARTEAELPIVRNPDATQTEFGPAASGLHETVLPTGAGAEAVSKFPSDLNISLPPDLGGGNSATDSSGSRPGGPLTAGKIGPYQLLGEIARGGMGVVFRARHPELERTVALKMVLGFPAHGDSLLQRFVIEAKAAAALDHPNVVPIYEIGQFDGRPYFTMALVEGGNLKEWCEKRGKRPVTETVALFAQVVAGVAHAHGKGIIHRDLKPANVLMDAGGRPRVTDFGLAKRREAGAELTEAGQVMGTPSYMAPEQAKETKDVGPAADVYSLGAILYYMLTGRPPFTAGSTAELYVRVLSESADPPSKLNPDVPRDVEAICQRCLAKAPADRYPDANALAAALAALGPAYAAASSFSGLSLPSAPPIPPSPIGLESTAFTVPGKPTPVDVPPRRKLPAVLTACVAVLALVAIGLAAFGPGKVPTPPVTPPATPGPEIAAKEATVPLAPVGHPEIPVKAELVFPDPPAAGPVLTLVDKSRLVLRLEAARDSHVLVWATDPNGDVVLLFPNKHETDTRLTAGVPRTVPGNERYDLPVSPTEGIGTDRLHVLVRADPFPPFEGGQLEGAVQLFARGKAAEAFQSALRGVRVRDRADHVPAAELALPFRVNP